MKTANERFRYTKNPMLHSDPSYGNNGCFIFPFFIFKTTIMILRGIETITREDNIPSGSCRAPIIVSQKFFAIVDYENGVTAKILLPSFLVDSLKDWSFKQANDKIGALNFWQNEHNQEIKNEKKAE